MRVLKYLETKNEILNKVTGFDMIPEDQLEDIAFTEAIFWSMKKYVDILQGQKTCRVYLTSDNCPYCAVYNAELDIDEEDDFDIDEDEPKSTGCVGCPMYKAGNQCFVAESSYKNTTAFLKTLDTKEKRALQKKLTALAKKFLSSNKHLIKEEK